MSARPKSRALAAVRVSSSGCSVTKGSTCTRRCTMELPAPVAGHPAARARRTLGRPQKAGHFPNIFVDARSSKRSAVPRHRCCSSTKSTVPTGVRAYLLELLSDFQMSIPEMGTVRAVSRRWWATGAFTGTSLSRVRRNGDCRDSGAGGAGLRVNGRVRAKGSPHGPAEKTGHRGASTGPRRSCVGIATIDDDGAEHPRNAERAHQDSRRSCRVCGRSSPLAQHADRRTFAGCRSGCHPALALDRLCRLPARQRLRRWWRRSPRVLERPSRSEYSMRRFCAGASRHCCAAVATNGADSIPIRCLLPANKKAFAGSRDVTPARLNGRVHQVTPPSVSRRRRPRRRGRGRWPSRTAWREPEESLASTDFRDLDQADQVRDIEALMRRFAAG